MNQFIYGTAVILVLGAVATAETPQEEAEAVAIPLDQIWAYRMPGTRDVLELEPAENEMAKNRLWTSIVGRLMADVSPDWPLQGETARTGFAVTGKGVSALQQVQKVLVNGQEPADAFTTEDQITLVFFSYQCGTYVHLQGVERRGSVIELAYRFVRPVDKISTVHLALVPMGKLPAGQYRVKPMRMQTAQQLIVGGYKSLSINPRRASIEKRLEQRFVCRPFQFSVLERRTN